MTKEIVYTTCFIILGIFVSFLVHAGIEIPVINLLVRDFNMYSLGLTWRQWQMVHDGGAVVLLILGIIIGYWQGVYWWDAIYIKRRFKK